MKKQVISLCMAAAATCGIFAAVSDRIDVYDATGKFVSIMVNDIKEITLGKEAGQEGYSTLNIVTVDGTRVKAIADLSDTRYTRIDYNTALEITKSDAENSEVLLLDWRNNTDVWGVAQIDPTKPADWRGCYPDAVPHFKLKTDKGFAGEYTITGVYTGKVYSDNPNFVYESPKEFNLLGQDCLAFDMPFEPVHVSASSYELETYLGQPFLGVYKGYRLQPGVNRIAESSEPVLSAEFKFNGTYVMKTTDDKNFDFLDLYDWNENTNTFSYVPYEGELKNIVDIEIKTGVTGKFDGTGNLFATFHDIINDIPENNVKYFASKDDIDFIVTAADEYNHRMLVQTKNTAGDTRYFFYDYDASYPFEVSLEFSFGSNIGADCTAFAVDADGNKLFKYDYKGTGSPEFTFRGAEYGNYSGSADLFLDGYNKCTVDGVEATYIIDGGLVDVTIGGEVRIFVVDRDARTCTEMVSDAWDGYTEYFNNEAAGSYRGEAENTGNKLNVQFDKDFAGNDAPGTAAVRFTVVRNDGFSASSDAVASAGKYIYNAESGTIIITNLYMGTSATTSTRRNLVLKVAADKRSLYIDDAAESRIYGTGRDGSYILTGEVNTLEAIIPAAPVELKSKYTGAPLATFMGSSKETETTLEINKADNTAKLTIKCLGSDLITPTFVSYTLEGNTFTLQQVDVYEEPAVSFMPPTAGKADIVFTVEADGSLTSTQTVGGSAMGSYFGVDFSTDALVAEEEEEAGVALAPKYAGAPMATFMGSSKETETTLEINAADSTAKLTIKCLGSDLIIPAFVAYTLESNTLTLQQVDVYEEPAVSFMPPTAGKADIVFTVEADGSLTSTQTIGGSAMGGYFGVDLSTAPLTVPAE